MSPHEFSGDDNENDSNVKQMVIIYLVYIGDFMKNQMINDREWMRKTPLDMDELLVSRSFVR